MVEQGAQLVDVRRARGVGRQPDSPAPGTFRSSSCRRRPTTLDREQPVIFQCRFGVRSAMAAAGLPRSRLRRLVDGRRPRPLARTKRFRSSRPTPASQATSARSFARRSAPRRWVRSPPGEPQPDHADGHRQRRRRRARRRRVRGARDRGARPARVDRPGPRRRARRHDRRRASTGDHAGRPRRARRPRVCARRSRGPRSGSAAAGRARSTGR